MRPAVLTVSVPEERGIKVFGATCAHENETKISNAIELSANAIAFKMCTLDGRK